MDIKEILNSIELTDEQVKALDLFFEEYSQQISAKAVQAYIESNGDVDNSEVEKLKKQIELHKSAFELFEKDVDKAFEIFEEHVDKAFAKFEEDVDKAFELYEEDVQKEFTRRLVESLDSLYGTLREKAEADFMESSEYATFKKIKELIMPYMENINQELMAKLIDLESSIASEKQKNQELSRKTMIDEFVAGIPEKHAAKAKAFLEEATTEDEILQRYDLFLEFLEDVVDDETAAASTEKTKNEIINEVKSRRARPERLEKRRIFLESLDEDDDLNSGEAIFESKTEEVIDIKKKEDPRLSGFSPARREILAAAGLIK